MLLELHVRNLGVIADLTVPLGPGMTAITGETGAGKTLIVEAIQLLVGERADPTLVREGADEAAVEGRFDLDGVEVVVGRVIPRSGRSRAYVDGRLATVAEVAELGRRLVDLHGQHTHQSLLSPAVQRAALDRYAGIDLGALQTARREVAEIVGALASLGGDARLRAREIDLLRFQLGELVAAAIDDPGEDDTLAAEEDRLGDAGGHREAGDEAQTRLADDRGALDAIGEAMGAVAGRGPFADHHRRLQAVAADLSELSSDLRRTVEGIEVDPGRLSEVQARRKLLGDLRRKYGENLADVVAFRDDAAERLATLENHGERIAELEAARDGAAGAAEAAAAVVAGMRRAAAPGLAAAVERHIRTLALPGARFEVGVEGPMAADDVTFGIGANVGEPVRPLGKVASGGELARTMLAIRLVLTEGPSCLVFDEVDAGIGGEAALAVGRALAALARGAGGPGIAGPGAAGAADDTDGADANGDPDGPGARAAGAADRTDGTGARAGAGGGDSPHQVLVVTHLPQVAAYAANQLVVAKVEIDGRTVAAARLVDGPDRVVELSRMLSGQPESAAARGHAEELLATASDERDR